MLNLDPIQKMLRQYSGMSVHGITDSGWFMDQQPYDIEDEGGSSASPVEAVKLGIPYWHSQIPSRCRNLYINEPSKCFIGYKIYPTLSGEYLLYNYGTYYYIKCKIQHYSPYRYRQGVSSDTLYLTVKRFQRENIH